MNPTHHTILDGSLNNHHHHHQDVEELRHNHRYGKIEMDSKLKVVCDEIEKGTFGDVENYAGLIASLTDGHDYYLVSDDFSSYMATQDLVDEAFRDKDGWATKCINSVAHMGFFSADRCINE